MDSSDSIISCDIKVAFSISKMKFYKYQRSRSFADLCPGCLRFSFNVFSSKTVGLIETKHVEPLWDKGRKVCVWDLGHMSKMATMSYKVKTLLKYSSQD